MRSYLLASITTLAFVVGATIAWRQWDEERAPDSDKQSQQRSNAQDESSWSKDPQANNTAAQSGSTRQQTDPFAEPDPRSDDFVRLSATDLSAIELPPVVQQQTSWQNPFRAELWDLASSRLDRDSLVFEGVGRAIFLRSYSRLMAEFTISDGQDAGHQSPLNFEIELFTPAQDDGVVVRLVDGECRLESHRANARPQVVRAQPIDHSIGGGQIRISATANRIMVGWNDRIVINATRPASLVNSQLYLQLINRLPAQRETDAKPVRVVVSDMRLEGE